MNIGELSARSGVSARSVRHYEKLGMISPERTANGYRSYGDGAVSIVSTIHTMFELGFTRDDVHAMLPCATGERGHDDENLLTRVEELRNRVDDRVRTLSGTRDTLTAFLHARGDERRLGGAGFL